MLKGKLVILSLLAAAVLCWQVLPATVNTVNSGVVDPCSTVATITGGPYCWVICPQGDGPSLNALLPGPLTGDATISVTVKDQTGAPVAGIPAADFWLVGCTDGIVLCAGAGSINASAATDVNGQTTINGAMFGGGCDDSVAVVVQGALLVDPADCVSPACLQILTRSPDITGDLQVESLDFTQFGNGWTLLGGTYNKCVDYDCNGIEDSLDFTIFGNHYYVGDFANRHHCN